MKNPKLVFEIVSQLVKAIEKPVTVKNRKGFDDDHINAVEIAKIAEEAGASAVADSWKNKRTVLFGEADWDIIRQVKEAVHNSIRLMEMEVCVRPLSRKASPKLCGRHHKARDGVMDKTVVFQG